MYVFVFDLLLADVVEAVANETVYPEHNMSLHPYFNFDVSRNVTARVGQTTFLQCKVEQLGDKSVSFAHQLSSLCQRRLFCCAMIFRFIIYYDDEMSVSSGRIA